MLKLHSFSLLAKKAPGDLSTSPQCISEIRDTLCLSQHKANPSKSPDWLGYMNNVLIGQLECVLPPLG